MSTELVTVTADEDLVLADEVMRLRRIRHLPVIRGKALVGILTHRDLLRAQARLLLKLASAKDRERTRHIAVNVKEIMQTDIETVAPNISAAEAARRLLAGKIGCLPVVDGDELVGIVTEADFLRWAVEALI